SSCSRPRTRCGPSSACPSWSSGSPCTTWHPVGGLEARANRPKARLSPCLRSPRVSPAPLIARAIPDSRGGKYVMAWSRTVSPEEVDERLQKALADQRVLYPKEYAEPIQALDKGLPGIVASHTLIPEALYHAFSMFGSLMAPDL